jgi:DNA replication protein DnaC
MSTIHNEAIKSMLERKNSAEFTARRIFDKLHGDNRFKELYHKRQLLIMELARREALNEDCADIDAELKRTKAKLKKHVVKLGHELSDITPKYACSICNDTGTINGEYCTCFIKLRSDILHRNNPSLITDIDDLTEMFVPEQIMNNIAYSQYYTEFYKFLQDLAKNYKDPEFSRIVSLIGKPGTGKTYALSVLTNHLTKIGCDVVMISAIQLSKIFLDYHTAPLDQKNEIFEPLIDCDVLIIDDLGTEPKYTNVTQPYLKLLLDSRPKNLTIFSSNMVDPVDYSERYGNSIYSRLFPSIRGKVIRFDIGNIDLRSK